MKERTVMVFPKFNNLDIIDSIRKKYDPLAKLVPPHLTLVFPFKSELTQERIFSELEELLSDYKAFKLVCHGVVKESNTYGNYLFLSVLEGMDNLIEIHDYLYDGIFRTYRSDVQYVPHLTIGNLHDKKEFDLAYQNLTDFNLKFMTIVDTISVEIIGEHGESNIEIEYSLIQQPKLS